MPELNRSAALLLKTAIDSGVVSPVELANLMGNASIETDSFTRMRERLNYKTVERITSVAGSTLERFTLAEIRAAVESRDPQRIATILYEGRNKGDLGNSEVGDGWRFHGRGYLQLTGRANYKKYGDAIGVDLVGNPDEAASHEVAARIAVAYWKNIPRRLRQDARHVGRSINGAGTARDERHRASARWSSIITAELIHDVQSGALDLEQLTRLHTDAVVVRPEIQSSEMAQLQQGLKDLGYSGKDGESLNVDGKDGPNTRLALEAFQRDHRLAINSHMDRSTLLAVHDAVTDKYRSFGAVDAPYLSGNEAREVMSIYRSVESKPVPIFEPNDEISIRRLQQDLNTLGITDMRGESLEQHGVYDISTQAAVARFQSIHGLPVTGQPDEQTRSVVDGQAFIAELQRLPRTPVNEAPRWEQTETQTQRPTPVVSPEPEPLRFSNPEHPQHGLYRALREVMPENTSEKRLAQITAACHEGGIRADRLGEVEIMQDSVVIFGTPTGYANVDLNQRPTEQQSLERVQAFDQQQVLELTQIQAQRLEASLSPAMVR